MIDENINNSDQEIELTKEKLKQIKNTIKKLDNFMENFEIIRNKIENPENGLNKAYEQSINIKSEIEKLYSDTNNTIQRIKSVVESIDLYYLKSKESYENIGHNVEESKLAKEEVLRERNTVVEKSNSMTSLLNKAQNKFEKIEQLLNKTENNIQNITGFLDRFNILKGKIEDKENGFESIIGKVNENLTQSNSILKLIEETRNICNKNLTEIENEKEFVKENSQKVKELKLKSEEDYKEIRNYLDIASDASFSESFKDRKDELSKIAKIWLIVLIISIGLLIFLLVRMFFEYIFKGKGIPTIESTIFRISVSSPLLFFIRFSGSEYSKSKKNEEKYAFKFATSSVFRNHIKFMIENFGEDKEGDVLQTTQGIFNMLYTPTYPTEDKLSKTEKEILNSYKSNKKLKNDPMKNIDEILELLQKAKDIVGLDPESLKLILSIFTK